MNKMIKPINFNEIGLRGIKIALTKSQDENYFLIRKLWKKFNLGLKNIKNNIKITINSNTFRVITVDKLEQ